MIEISASPPNNGENTLKAPNAVMIARNGVISVNTSIAASEPTGPFNENAGEPGIMGNTPPKCENESVMEDISEPPDICSQFAANVVNELL